MNEFKWEKGDEGWEEEGALVVAEPKQGWPSFLLVGVLLLFLLGGWYWLNKQVDSAEALVIAEVKEAVLLFDQMYELGDGELLEELYLPVEEWPLPILGELFLFERRSWGLEKEPLDQSPEIDVLLSSGLNEADVSVLYQYEFDAVSGEKDLVTLKQQLFWEKVDGGWRLAIEKRPLGTKHKLKGAYFEIEYWEIDSDRVEEIALWLELLLAEICLDEKLVCERIHLPIGLDFREPGYYICPRSFSCADYRPTFSDIAEYQTKVVDGTFQQQFSVQFPSPTFLGTPVDEQGEQVLKQLYALHILENILPDLMDRERAGSQQTRFILEQVTQLLEEKGLRPKRSEVDRSEIEEALLLHCPEEQNNLFYYQFGDRSWIQLSGMYEAMELNSENDQLILSHRAGEVHLYDKSGELLLLNREPLLFQPEVTIEWVVGGGQEGVLLQLGNRSMFQFEHYFLDLNQCRMGGCEPELRESIPESWSSDGRWLISSYQREGSSWLAVEDWASKRVVWEGEGHHPFWLGSAEYGYIREEEGDVLEEQHGQLVSALVTDHQPRVLVTHTQFEQLIPQQELADQLLLISLELNPNNSNQILLVGFIWDEDSNLRRYYFFNYHRGTKQIDLLMEEEEVYSYMVSDDWQTLGISYLESGVWQLQLYDFVTGDGRFDSFLNSGLTQRAPTHDWSLDGQWGARLESDLLFVFDKEFKQQELIIPPISGCRTVRWVNREIMEGIK